MVIFNSIGYFTTVLLSSSLVLHDPLHIQIPRLLSLLCHPYLPASLSELNPSLFFSDPPPCYIIPLFDAQIHLGSKI
jgi:hypothetical protein